VKRNTRRYNRNRASGGAGLGLAITKRILELHDIAIAVESTSKLGTCFSFSLPVYAPTWRLDAR
jgi:signal transduction histidine kinase